MDGISCDGCGEGLLLGSDVRYLVKIEVYAAYDPLELTRNDLARDSSGEMAGLLERMAQEDPRRLEDQVYKKFQFDLCPRCHERYLRDPLGWRRERGGKEGEE